MKGTSKIIMGATLVMVVSLAMVLGLVLVLLAELYCSLLLRRRRHQQTTNATPSTTTTTTNSANQSQHNLASLTNIYSHGVLHAPRTLLFPATFDKHLADIEKPHHSHPSQTINPISTLNQPSLLLSPQSPSSISLKKTPVFSPAHSNKHVVGIEKDHNSPLNPTSPISQSSLLLTPPHSPRSISLQETPFQPVPFPAHFNKQLVGKEPQIYNPTSTLNQASLLLTPRPSKVPFQCDSTRTSMSDTENVDFMYISNPIYDNEAGSRSRADTPFETPDTSPSRLGGDDSSGEEGERSSVSSPASAPVTPPLTPMKKLPAEACSVSLTDGRCLGTSGSDSNSNNGGTSSSSGSPCTSPSW